MQRVARASEALLRDPTAPILNKLNYPPPAMLLRCLLTTFLWYQLEYYKVVCVTVQKQNYFMFE